MLLLNTPNLCCAEKWAGHSTSWKNNHLGELNKPFYFWNEKASIKNLWKITRKGGCVNGK